jgi:hypothetical protein
MPSKKSGAKKFNGMGYGEVQRANSDHRSQLNKADQKWLKENGYKNVGWEYVISLFEKIKELLDPPSGFEEMSLEELFLEADRIGNKYLTSEEIQQFDQQLSQEVSEISALVDRQFPDTEIEIIDFSQKLEKIPRKIRDQKTYRTVKP